MTATLHLQMEANNLWRSWWVHSYACPCDPACVGRVWIPDEALNVHAKYRWVADPNEGGKA